MNRAEFLTLSCDIAIAMLLIGLVISLARLWRGPVMADRLVALEMMTTLIIGFCGLYAIRTGVRAWLDIALALALVSFVATVAFARYAQAQQAGAQQAGAAHGKGGKDGEGEA